MQWKVMSLTCIALQYWQMSHKTVMCSYWKVSHHILQPSSPAFTSAPEVSLG